MELPTPNSRYIAESSKKKDFPGSSSSSGFEEVKILETALSSKINSELETSENKEVCEIIDLDDTMHINGETDIKGKDKEISSDLAVDNLSDLVDLDDPNISLLTSRDKLLDKYYNAMMMFDDYTVMDSQFDRMDMPPDVEVPFPFLQGVPTPPNNTTTPTNLSLEIEELNDARSALDSTPSHYPLKKLKFKEPWNESLLSPVQYQMISNPTNVEANPNDNLQTGLTGSSSLSTGSGSFPPVKNFPVMFHAMMTGSGFGSGPCDIRANMDLELPPGPVVEQSMDDNMHNFDRFRKFDTVEDCSDHYYAAKDSLNQATRPKNWAKRIQEEWKILENNLPDTIFVRVYESRMDLLRAVIVGAESTPYHDGLFFFDISFPVSYPDSPPQVHYHSGGLRLNPNLYNNGKVCLSLLNTWSGERQEEWIPGVSTMLQVLVSIQGLILNAEPYFNEPAHAGSQGTEWGQMRSLGYNETVFILSVQNMVYSINRPPKHFEAFVTGHFRKYAQDILVSCKAYLEGAQVGCLVRGGIQDVDEGDKSCSTYFKYRLARFVTTLINAFTLIGAKDCNKFKHLVEMVPKIAAPPSPSPPSPFPMMPYYFP